MEMYTSLEEKRIDLYNSFKVEKKKSNYFIIGFVVAFLFIVIGVVTQFDIFSFIGILIGIVSGICLIIFQTKAYKYKTIFDNYIKDEFVDKVLSEHFEESHFSPKGHIPVQKVNSIGLVSKPDRFNGEDLITGKYKGINFAVSDLTLTQVIVVNNGKTTYTQYIDFFKGRWYVYKFPKNFRETIKIVESSNGVNTRGLKKYETEMIDFNKKFSIFSSDERFFYYLMNPYLIEKLLQLEKSHKGTIHYAFVDDELHIGINDSSNSLVVNFNKVINKESLSRFIEDIVLIKTIIDELRLYDDKFTK